MTHIQNDKQALLCLRFVYLFRFLFLIDEYSLLPPADIYSYFLSNRSKTYVLVGMEQSFSPEARKVKQQHSFLHH